MLTNLSSKHLRVTWQQTIQAGRPLAPSVSSVLWLQSPQTADIPVLMMKTNINFKQVCKFVPWLLYSWLTPLHSLSISPLLL